MNLSKKNVFIVTIGLAISSNAALANTQALVPAGKSGLTSFIHKLNDALCKKLWPRTRIKHCEVAVENLRFASATQSRSQSIVDFLEEAGAAVVDGTNKAVRLPITRRALGGNTDIQPIQALTSLDLDAGLQDAQADVDQALKALLDSFGADMREWKINPFYFTDGSDLSYSGAIIFHEARVAGKAPDAIWISVFSGG